MKIKLLDNFYSVIFRKKMFLFIGVFLSLLAYGQQSISSLTTPYQQNFNALGTANVTVTGGNLNLKDAALNGWYFNETGSNADNIVVAGTGSANSGSTYNFGASGGADRTLGSLVSSTLGSSYGFYFKNTTGVTVTSIKISYTGKTWRVGFANRSDRLQFQYSTGATSLTTGAWTDVTALDYINPGQAVGSGSLQHSAVVTATITGLSIANNANFFIRWNDVDITGTDDGMGIDDVSIVLNPVSLTYNGNSQTSGAVPVDANSPYAQGSTVTVLGNTGTLARTGYTFAGWNTLANGTGTNYVAGNTFTINANIILYAKWNINCSAPTVSSTTSAANSSTTGVDLTGSVTAIGGANVNEVGFNYSTSSTLASPLTAGNTGLSVSTVPYSISKSLTGLQANTLYYYRAYAINNCTTPQTSYSHTSGYPSFTTLSLAPVSTAADNILTDSFRANWTAPASQGAAAYTYHLQIDDNIDFSSPIYDNQNETGLNHTQGSLVANTTYYYRVSVKNAGGDSAWSSVQTVTTAASNKPVVTASSFNGTVGISFSQNIIATNIPDSYAIVAGNNLPAGLSLNTTNGAITGIPTTAGTFTTNVTATKNGETSDPATITFIIAKGSQTISGLPATASKTYGDAAYTLSAVSSSGLTVSYISSNTSVATISGNTVTIVGAGTSTITAQQIGDTNWNAAADVAQTLTVAKKDLSITGLTASDKTYDQTTSVVINGTPQYSGLVNGDNFAVTGSVSWAFANKNAAANKVLVRTGDYDVPSGNYTVTQPSLQAAINKKDIAITSITADDKVYNTTPNATFSNVSSADVFSGDVVVYTLTGSFSDANAGVDKAVTVLSVVLSGADGGNYNVPLFPTGLTADIAKANQTITVNNFPVTLNVGSSINLMTFALSTSNLPLSYTSSVPAIASISSGMLTGNNAGTTIITFSQSGDNNYNAAVSVQKSIDVLDVPVPLAQWDFSGISSSGNGTSVTAQTINASLNSGSAVLTRGSGAPWSAGSHTFRTDGFKNDGIATTNTDYFQTSFVSSSKVMSLTSINANIYGSGSFVSAPGANVQFAYSLDGTTYQLINSPVNITSGNAITTRIIFNISNVSGLQNIKPNTTVYFRFYATGQSTTGTMGFVSASSAGTVGLQFDGTLKPSEIIWNGSEWSNYNGPVKTQNVIIDGAYSLSQGFEANNMTITEDGLLTILPNQGVTINGDITMPDDKIIIQSDGSLVQTKLTNGNTGNKAIAKRITNMRTSDYTFWSSPVKDQPLLNTVNPNAANSSGGFSQGTPNNRTYQYNEPDDTFRATPDANFINAKGYAIRGKSTYGNVLTLDELTYRGVLNNGDISVQIQKSRNTSINGISYEHGYNLIGNPYPSHIDFEKFYNLDKGDGEKNSDVIFGKAWFWSNISIAPSQQGGSAYTANNYATLTLAGGTPATGTEEDGDSATPNNFIKLGQGFIVQMRGTPPTGAVPNFKTLKFDNSIRSNNSTGVFYNSKQNQAINRYWLKFTSPKNVVNTILLAHMTEATDNYDPDYDAELLSVGDDSFYSKLQAKKLQIQARKNPFSVDDVVTLATKQAMDGLYKISLGNKEGVFDNGQSIYLRDKTLNKIVNLSQGAYLFQAVKGTDEGRFEIVYKDDAVLADSSVKKSDFEVYKDGVEYVVRSSKKLGQVDIYDTSGRLVKSYHSKENVIKINVSSLSEGVYIIKAENSGDIKTKKIIK